MCKQKDLVQQSIEDKTYSNFHEAIRKIFTKEYFYKDYVDNFTEHEKTFLINLKDLRVRLREFNYPVHNISRLGEYNDYKDIFVVYHEADIDGHSVKIINGLLNNGDMSNTFGCDVRADEAFDIIKEKLDEGMFVIVADLNFTEEYAERVENELDTSRFILLDHHGHAMYLNQYDWAFVLSHDEESLYLSSGTLLYSMFCVANFNCNLILDTIIDLAMNTALYDTWFWSSNFDYTRELSEKYFGNRPEDICMLFKSMSKDKYAQHVLNNINNFHDIFDNDDKLKIKFMRDMTRKTIYRYYHNMRIVNIDDKKIGIVFGDNEVSAVGNFILRANRELSYFAMVNLNSNQIYLRCRNDYDVKEIAIRNGGGGHTQAAGFPMIDILFNDKFLIDLLSKTHQVEEDCLASIKMIKDCAEFDEDTKVYRLR